MLKYFFILKGLYIPSPGLSAKRTTLGNRTFLAFYSERVKQKNYTTILIHLQWISEVLC